MATTRNGNYIDVEGVPTYYEVTGTGAPLITRNVKDFSRVPGLRVFRY